MKRTSLLCVLAAALIVAIALPASAVYPEKWWNSNKGAVELFRVSAQGGGGGDVPQAPAYIEYTLNCKATVKVEILPSDSAGTPTSDPAVRTETLTDQLKGPHQYLWPCIKDDLSPAPVGYYVAKLTASSSPTQWDANLGLYINWQRPVPRDEHVYRDTAGTVFMPVDTAQGMDGKVGGFYGIGVNNNPSSPFYGRIYVPHQTNRDVYMYDVDGTFLGAMNDSGITWNTSAPWDCQVAEDGYVFVSDRTAMAFYIFKPDGSAWISRSNVLTTNDRAIGVRLVAGVHHCLISSGTEVYDVKATIAPDGLSATWANRVWLYTATSSADTAYGMCANSDMTIIYQACRAGTQIGVRKWAWNGSAWVMNPTWKAKFYPTYNAWAASTAYVVGNFVRPTVSNNHRYRCTVAGTSDTIEPPWPTTAGGTVVDGTVTWTESGTMGDIECADVEIAADGNLWVTASRGNTWLDPSMYKVAAADGAYIGSYDIIGWGFMLGRDAVGNVAVTFGKSTASWPGNYWGMFAPPGEYSATKTTGAFYCPEDPSPVLVPGSETWTYGSAPPDMLSPDGFDTAQVSFQIIDANGFSDIGDVDMDLKELKTTDDPTPVEQPDTKVVNGSNGMIADCTKTVTAIRGTQCGAREIGITSYDSDTAEFTTGELNVAVAGNQINGYVKHSRTGAEVIGATLYAQGGTVGAYGYPFTYTSPYTSDVLGNVTLDVSEGTFEVWVEKLGYSKQASQTIIAPMVTIPATVIDPPDYLYVGPLTVAGARDLERQTMYISVEGLTYARPKGIAPTVCTGMDDRLDTATSPTSYYNRRMWYMCDPENPEEGMQFQLKIPDTSFTRQWDDSAKIDPITRNPLYLGKRPDEGDTICVSGWLETRPGYETRVILDDASLQVYGQAKYKYIYYNLTQYGIEVTKPLPTAYPMTIPDFAHADNVSHVPSWGRFGEVTNVTPVAWKPNGINLDGTFPADPNMYVIITDSAGNWATVTFQSLTSLNIPPGTATMPPPVTLGDTYTFKGACGRRSRFGVGTMRVRGTGDMNATATFEDPGADSVGVIRGISSGSVTFRGIVTAKFTGYMFVESSDRSVGVKVVAAPWWVAVGDEVQVGGDVQLLDGQKQVLPSRPIALLSSGHALPELGMRHRDVGGVDYDPVTDPGVYHGRGPLNVGLLVTVSGLCTYRDDAISPTFFYIWDGSNMCLSGADAAPLDDGTGYRGLRIDNNGWLPSPASRAVKAYQDWVTVNGIVVVKKLDVGAETIYIPAILPKTVTLNTSFSPIQAVAGTALTALTNMFSITNIPAATGPGIVPYNTWAASTAYSVGDIVVPTVSNTHKYRCTVAGNSGATEPVWTTTTVVDGTVTWQRIGWDYNGDPNGPCAWEVPQVLAPTKDPGEVDGRVFRFESANLSQYMYDQWAEPNGTFGGALMGDGYWVLLDSAWAVNYTGLDEEFPQWIATSAPNCWVLIGHPQDHPTDTTLMQMSDGGVVKSYFDASQWNANWFQSTGFWWDNQFQNQYDIGDPNDWPYTTVMMPWLGYTFLMNEPNRAWIIP